MSLIGTMDSGVSALRTYMKGLEVIGNNIANVNTTGYKGSQAEYADSFSNILKESSASSAGAPAAAVGTGVKLAGISTDFSQGSLSSTGKATDLGISGNGYFRVKDTASGSEYVTRAGDFHWDTQGYLVTSQGFRVQGVNSSGAIGDIKMVGGTNFKSVAIDSAGHVVETANDGTTTNTNQILMQNFNDPASLVKEGNNLFSGMGNAGPTNGSTTLLADGTNAPGSSGLGSIEAGTLELSNVDLTEQFSDLITTQRSFQAGSRLITVSDSVLEDIVNLKSR